MMRNHAFRVLAFLAASSALGELEFRSAPPTHVIVEERDLTAYADGGEFTNIPLSGGKVPRIDQLRRFVWQHWTGKTRAYARLAMSGIDSTYTTHLFVEPDKSGSWRVALRGVNEGYPCPTCHRWFLSDTLYVTSVQWTTSEDAKKLSFKDRRGKKIFEL